MKQLNKEQCKWIDLYFALSKKDMPLGICEKRLKDNLKGLNPFYCYEDFFISVRLNINDMKNKQKINLIGTQFSYLLSKALEDELYEICYNLSEWFIKINIQLDYLNSIYLNGLANQPKTIT
jgi:hypothetical protein